MSGVETPSERRSRRARAVGLAVLYGSAVVAGLIFFVVFTIQVHGLFGQYEADPAADIPAIVALLVPLVLGFYLGWRLPPVASARNRALLAGSTVVAAGGFTPLLDGSLTGPEPIAFLAAYALGPPLLGRSVKVSWVTIRDGLGRAPAQAGKHRPQPGG